MSRVASTAKASTRLIFVRHGETELNRTGRLRGLLDASLNATGRTQARAVARRLSTVAVDIVYASPLARTMETAAAIVRGRRVAVVREQRLRDIDYGLWAGRTPDDVERNGPGSFRRWHAAPDAVRIPNGEAFASVRRRIRTLVREVVLRHSGRTVVLVSHDFIGRAMLGLLLDMPASRIRCFAQDNGAINIIDVYGREIVVRAVNDATHLGSPLGDLKRGRRQRTWS